MFLLLLLLILQTAHVVPSEQPLSFEIGPSVHGNLGQHAYSVKMFQMLQCAFSLMQSSVCLHYVRDYIKSKNVKWGF